MYDYENSNDENTHSSGSEMSNNCAPHELNNQSDKQDENDIENSRVSGGGINHLFIGVSQQSSESNGSARLLRVPKSRYEDEEDEDDEDNDEDDNDSSASGGGGEEGGEKKKRNAVMVGSDYQAAIPDSLCKYGNELPYQNEDKLLWNPCNMTDEEVKNYLAKAQEPLSDISQGVNAIPTGNHMRDDEQALYLLMQSDYSVEEALKKRRKTNVLSTSDGIPLWSEEECRNFETGLRNFEKNFRLIQQNNVKTRTVGELIQFYYIWKKTERHDMFAHKRRLEKRKYSLHPGITDYMDRFLEEQEIALFPRDRSTSPNLQSLVYGTMLGQQTSEMAVAELDSVCNVDNQLDKDKTESSTSFNSYIGDKVSDDKQDSEATPVSSTTLPTTTVVEMTYSSTTLSASLTTPSKDEVSHAEESMVQ